MKIIIDIPKEFQDHFNQDKFEDTLLRLKTDARLMAGNYEKETAVMLIKAFKESIPLDKIVEQLEKKHTDVSNCTYLENSYVEGYCNALDVVINGIKGEE